MADTKISALPAATTPLGGTEVLPIVQGGATKQVSVANLTAGRNVDANVVTTQGVISVAGSSGLPAGTGSTAYFAGGFASPITGRLYIGDGTGWSYYISKRNTSVTTDLYQFADNGNMSMLTGNLIPSTAAKGVNFTANTPVAGMTSQLLNWYEEGSFTATAVPDTGTITLSTATLRYTRVGRMVNISGYLVVGSVSAPTNNVYIATLPFVAGILCGGGIAIDGTNAFAGQVGWFINAGQQSLYIYYRDALGAYVASAAIFTAGTVIRIDATYTV